MYMMCPHPSCNTNHAALKCLSEFTDREGAMFDILIQGQLEINAFSWFPGNRILAWFSFRYRQTLPCSHSERGNILTRQSMKTLQLCKHRHLNTHAQITHGIPSVALDGSYYRHTEMLEHLRLVKISQDKAQTWTQTMSHPAQVSFSEAF